MPNKNLFRDNSIFRIKSYMKRDYILIITYLDLSGKTYRRGINRISFFNYEKNREILIGL
jgi:hypothetical protein